MHENGTIGKTYLTCELPDYRVFWELNFPRRGADTQAEQKGNCVFQLHLFSACFSLRVADVWSDCSQN